MVVQNQARWKNWADSLRKEMMGSLTPEVTKSVTTIADETATTLAESTLHKERFWLVRQSGKSPIHILTTAGFEIELQQDEKSNVQEVTFKLNETWLRIMQGVLDRKNR